ncbi:substrate-binding periplasmic protein [Desulfonema magnum]|uniref:Extracellular solute-binding protein, family 3 n=1 Tax=Desulfonema magnum TaxID=45655 RepID=A0A975BSK4_9BACT|nr:transporter substrate-binding domain-containing protein [Desulfonema magnum]QTA90901.1 Extracellular solute-binding protein, family 3 [Desulfonema magnum]
MKQLILSFILILTCCIGKYPCAYGESIELTAGAFKGAEPFYTSQERNGKIKISGMNVEIINAFVRKAPEFQIKLQSQMLPVPRLFKYLQDNTVQVVFGVAKNTEREKIYQYSDIPLYPVKFSFIVRADDKEVHHISTFEEMKRSGGTVLGVRGSNAINLFEKKTNHLSIPTEVVPTIEQNFKKMFAGRGRYFVFNNYSLIDGAKQFGFYDRIIMIPLVLKEGYHWLVFSKAVPQEVVQKANAVLHELQESGELRKIYERYGNLQ